MQEVQEATDQLKKILASTEDYLKQRRSLQREMSVPEPVSDIEVSAEAVDHYPGVYQLCTMHQKYINLNLVKCTLGCLSMRNTGTIGINQ